MVRAKPNAAPPPNAVTPPLALPTAAGASEVLRPLTAAAEATALIARDIAPAVLDALGTLAARMVEPAMLFDTIFVPSANPLLETGSVPGRPDIRYRWAHDETTVTFTALVDGERRPLTGGSLQGDAFLDEHGKAIAVSTNGPDGRRTLVTSVDVLDRAVAELKSRAGSPDVARSRDDRKPKLCPDPTPEPKTTKSENSIRYQEYVSGLSCGLAIKVGGVFSTAATQRPATFSRPRRTSISCSTARTI